MLHASRFETFLYDTTLCNILQKLSRDSIQSSSTWVNNDSFKGKGKGLKAQLESFGIGAALIINDLQAVMACVETGCLQEDLLSAEHECLSL